jgi:molybdate transport system regulatory protein
MNLGEGFMQTSARNQFFGTVKEIIKGPVSAEVTIAIAPGVDVVATISARSAEGLALAVGKPVQALIKASNVIIAVG